MNLTATCLGYPRIGAARELKRALELFWAYEIRAQELEQTATNLRARHWQAMQAAGIRHVPTNDFSLYDQVLDAAVMLGAIPARYRTISNPLTRYFAMARGLQDAATGIDVAPMEMTKWFDTNYHYIVPEVEADQRFGLHASTILRDIEEARALGATPRPVVLGPASFLLLAKPAAGADVLSNPWAHLDRILPVYSQLLTALAQSNVEWVQIDEPCLTLELDGAGRAAYERAFATLAGHSTRPRLFLATYFGALHENTTLAASSGFDALHIDLVRAPTQLDAVLSSLNDRMALSVGVVDGRNVWRTDLDAAYAVVRKAVQALGPARVIVAPSCSLLHCPYDLRAEVKLDPEVCGWLAFAEQKLHEVVALADATTRARGDSTAFVEARAALASRRASPRTHNEAVRARLAAIDEGMLRRTSPFTQRAVTQAQRFRLPPFPTTTIGSFPQTEEVRAARAAWRAGRLDDVGYRAFLEAETKKCVVAQEALDLDVLVHGEFERTDMVEHFGEQLDGFVFTAHGWVQGYGSRCVKPPIIFGDVARPGPMTVDWARYAQSLTKRPVKGMLTGPVTILQWSFVRDDQPRELTTMQIALALRDEVRDLERAGIAMIQVDEPAIREGLPLRRKDWAAYLRWAVDAFRLSTAGVQDATQIHTHMCYSEFGEILDAVGELDADMLSIESSRSRMELLRDFARSGYPNQIGPGVYDIHSPRVPSATEMFDLLTRAADVLAPKQLWVNPDCGLKTRKWPEVEASLSAMVEAAKRARAEIGIGAA